MVKTTISEKMANGEIKFQIRRKEGKCVSMDNPGHKEQGKRNCERKGSTERVRTEEPRRKGENLNKERKGSNEVGEGNGG